MYAQLLGTDIVDVESTWSLLKHRTQPKFIQVKKLITIGKVWVSYNQGCVCCIQHQPPFTIDISSTHAMNNLCICVIYCSHIM